MNLISILTIGAKLIAATTIGLSILGLFGIKINTDTISGSRRREDRDFREESRTDKYQERVGRNSPSSNNNNYQPLPISGGSSDSSKLLNGLRTFQFVCGGVGDILQSVVQVVGSWGRLSYLQKGVESGTISTMNQFGQLRNPNLRNNMIGSNGGLLGPVDYDPYDIRNLDRLTADLNRQQTFLTRPY